ncbi:hypothetical protein L4C36_05555 [Photobacterium japonica]|uniref:hypothetical protein n=1 Tax=Photobacterium japonica TaxID=2910235 RepID=UPI003D14CA72
MKAYSIGLVSTLFLLGCGGGDGDSSANGSGTTTPTTGENSSACFNSDVYQIGTEVVEEYALMTNGIDIGTYTSREVVARTLSYEGYNNVLEIENSDSLDGSGSAFVVVDDAAKSIRTLGSLTAEGVDIKYKPSGLLLEYNLDMGETREYSPVTVLEDGVDVGTIEASMTYLKNETVTVPAGTFDTCLFSLTMDVVNADGTTAEAVFTQHFGVGNSLIIKETVVSTLSTGEAITLSEELVSATINGNAI